MLVVALIALTSVEARRGGGGGRGRLPAPGGGGGGGGGVGVDGAAPSGVGKAEGLVSILDSLSL